MTALQRKHSCDLCTCADRVRDSGVLAVMVEARTRLVLTMCVEGAFREVNRSVFGSTRRYLLQHVNSTTITNIVTVGTLNIQVLWFGLSLPMLRHRSNVHDKHQPVQHIYRHSTTHMKFAGGHWLAHLHKHGFTHTHTHASYTQCLMVFMLWVINFRIVRAREVLSKPDNPTHETLAVSSLMGKDNDALDQDLAAEEYSTHTEI